MRSLALPSDERHPSGTAPPLRVEPWLRWTGRAAIVLSFFCLLAAYPLQETDEARYGEIAREMLDLGDWVTPHLNYVKYFEKPPLLYWLTAFDLAVAGKSDFVVRLWPALFALLGVGVTYFLARSMYGRWSAYVASALLATTPLYFGLSQVVLPDMALSSLMALALSGFWFAYAQPERRGRFVALLYGATALAVLAKGPVAAVLVAGIVLIFLLLRRDLAALRWLCAPPGIGLFLLIAAPWFVLVSLRNPEFVSFFFIKQHIGRFLTPEEHRRGLWFYVPIVFCGMLPWTILPLLMPGTLRRFASRLRRRQLGSATLLCAVWGSVVFAFFSASASKLGTYILPMLSPLAILAACLLHQIVVTARARVLARFYASVLTFAALVVAAACLGAAKLSVPGVAIVLPRVVLAALTMGAAAAAALVLARRGALQASLALLAGGMLLVQLWAISARVAAPEYRSLGLFLRIHAAPADRIVLYRHYTQGIAYYAEHRAILLGGRGELEFGSRQGDQHDYFWDSDEPLVEAWRQDGHVFLVIDRPELTSLLPRLDPPPREVAAHGRKVVVVNFDEDVASGRLARARRSRA